MKKRCLSSFFNLLAFGDILPESSSLVTLRWGNFWNYRSSCDCNLTWNWDDMLLRRSTSWFLVYNGFLLAPYRTDTTTLHPLLVLGRWCKLQRFSGSLGFDCFSPKPLGHKKGVWFALCHASFDFHPSCRFLFSVQSCGTKTGFRMFCKIVGFSRPNVRCHFLWPLSCCYRRLGHHSILPNIFPSLALAKAKAPRAKQALLCLCTKSLFARRRNLGLVTSWNGWSWERERCQKCLISRKIYKLHKQSHIHVGSI